MQTEFISAVQAALIENPVVVPRSQFSVDSKTVMSSSSSVQFSYNSISAGRSEILL